MRRIMLLLVQQPLTAASEDTSSRMMSTLVAKVRFAYARVSAFRISLQTPSIP